MKNIRRLYELTDRLDVSKVRHPRLVDVLRNLEHDGFMFRSRRRRHHTDYTEWMTSDHYDVSLSGDHWDEAAREYRVHRDHADHTDYNERIHEDVGSSRPHHTDSELPGHRDYTETRHVDQSKTPVSEELDD